MRFPSFGSGLCVRGEEGKECLPYLWVVELLLGEVSLCKPFEFIMVDDRTIVEACNSVRWRDSPGR